MIESRVQLTAQMHQQLTEAQRKLGIARLDLAISAFLASGVLESKRPGEQIVRRMMKGLPAVLEAMADE